MTKSGYRNRFTVEISDAGLEFAIGDEINPTWDQLRICLRKLWELGYGDYVVPPNVSASTLAAGNQEQLEVMVPYILQRVNEAKERGKLDTGDEFKVIAIAYVIAWYWHMKLRGPRPIEPEGRPKRYHPIYQTEVILACPFCGKRYDPPKNYKKSSSRSRAWIQWLIRHNRDYHKWQMTYQIGKEFLRR